MRDEPLDPEVESADRTRLEWDVVVAVAIGGVLGAEARYGLGVLAPHHAGRFPWMTLVINVTGCAVIGLLFGALGRMQTPPRLARPLLGTGILGGYTTFSSFGVDVDTLVHGGRWGLAVGYLVATVVLCLAAVTLAFRAVERTGRTG